MWRSTDYLPTCHEGSANDNRPTGSSWLRIARVVAPVSLLLALTLAAACGDDDDDDDDGGDDDANEEEALSLEGTPWLLSSGIDVDGWEAVAPSAAFEAGTVSGSSGCNRFNAGYEVDGDALELGNIAGTRMACQPPADEVETVYLAALEQVRGWRIEDDELVLIDEDNSELLRFLAATPVGDWEVTGFQTDAAVVSPLPGTTLTATFAEDGTLSGSSGCNTYSGTYTIDGNRIEIGQLGSTLAACEEPEGIMDQEAAYLEALSTAVSFEVSGGSLSLLREDGTFAASYIPAGSQ